MKIYCCSDIHGCLAEFEDALSLITEHLNEPDTVLCLLGDYVHGGPDNYGVIDRIMSMQNIYGPQKVVALMGNHEEFILSGYSTINSSTEPYYKEENNDAKYISWIKNLPRYYTEGKTIFVHAGIDETAGDMWKWGTGDEIFVGKYPAQTGYIDDLDMKVVAGHIGTAAISENPQFHDIYYDGASHYYIDGSVSYSGVIPVLLVDTDEDKYYKVTKTDNHLVIPYDEEH